MSNKTAGQRVFPSNPGVMESVQRVQREMDMRNTRNEDEERQWALCKTAAEQAVGQIMLRQGLMVPPRDEGMPFDLGLASSQQVSTGQYPLQFQAQHVIATATAPAGIHVQDATMYSSNSGMTDDIPPRRPHVAERTGIPCSTVLAILEMIIIFLFGLFVNYDNALTARPDLENPSSYRRQQHEEDSSGLHHFYPCKF